jgi:CDP-glycerol glycerophosphotransferase (TagB/SpsB family)
MRIIILIQALFLSYSLNAQDGDGFLMTGNNTSRTEIEKRILKLEKVEIANLDIIKLGLHYMNKSNLYLYSGRDSAFIFLQKALELNRKNVCVVLWHTIWLYKRGIVSGNKL